MDWFGCNMADLFCPDSYFDNPPIPAAFEVNQSHRRPSVLFAPEAPIDFDIETGPLLAKDDFQDLAPGFPKDILTLKVPPTPRRNPRRKTRYSNGNRNGERTDNGPPPRTKQAHEPLPPTTTEYKNPSSAVKSRERNWERLRQYFAWLPKHSFHCTTTDLARPPTNAHHEHKYHPLSPLPEPISCMVVLVGIVKHDCHNMTNIFLFLETNNVLLPSDICSALPPTRLHKRLVLPDGEELALPTITKSIDLSDGEELIPPTKIKSIDHKSLKTIVHSSDVESDIEDVLLEEKDLIGRTFLLSPDDEGYVQCAKIVELNYKHNRNTDIQPARIELCLNIDKGKYEHVMAYHEIHKWSETDKDNPIDTKLKQVVYHHHYIRLEQPSYYLGLTYSMTIGWKHGENTPEPLNITGANESVTYAIY
ncbi:unnamed protein product [Cylindrotheca closterium]|uniref:Uncharacterized protein n=1 Tax=Cylindrotheca closterium TaxID=2856 RepID=A0AAD2FXU4_9STRA|nr:unnamed protein product [Cylindrotheca closterium]